MVVPLDKALINLLVFITMDDTKIKRVALEG